MPFWALKNVFESGVDLEAPSLYYESLKTVMLKRQDSFPTHEGLKDSADVVALAVAVFAARISEDVHH